MTAAVLTASAAREPAAIPTGAIAADTRMGVVELRVHDLPRLTAFYGPTGVGLEVLEQGVDSVSLGSDGEELVRRVAAQGPYAAPADAGLFHTAILFGDAPALATALVNVGSAYPGLCGGSADHAVSHAFYFADPEGNGVELYVDTPCESWVWQDGEVQMGSAPLDINAFVEEHLSEEPTGGATVGHVHLRVGDLEQAETFYAHLLGFAVTARSDGAGERPAALGLGSVEALVPDAASLTAIAARLSDASAPFVQDESGIAVADPWGTLVEIAVAP